MNTKHLWTAFLLLPLLGACSDPLSEYQEVEGLRVLAISADKPQLFPGESATITALVTEDATYSWSYCPFALPLGAGGECAITHAEFQEIADQILPNPVVIPPYDLGSGESAVFAHDVPPMFYQAVCDFLLSGEIPDGFSPPDCRQKYEIQVRLDVESGGKTLASVSSLDLLYDEMVPANTNPVLAGISASLPGGQEFVLDAMAPTPMTRGELYDLKLDIGEDSSEMYRAPSTVGGEIEDKQENLIATWFYTGGSIDKSRSSFVPGSVDIETLQENEYTAPTVEDFAESAVTLYFVIRDGRGGTSFQSREIELVSP